MQGDVMKESMSVATTLAWNRTCSMTKNKLLEQEDENKNLHGIHIHCPEGAVRKDGPSAGTAITSAIYSLLNNKKIRNDIAITGEINLQGDVTIIGGLDLKILGGIKAGIKEFLIPEENEKDLGDFLIKYKDNNILLGIKFHLIKDFTDVMDIIYLAD